MYRKWVVLINEKGSCMQILNFNKASGKRITNDDSNFVMNRILRTKFPVQIGCIYLEENGIIGYHQANVSQLLLITEGEGKVRGQEDRFEKVQQGNAIFWDKDEWHETVMEDGLVGIVVEGANLKSALFPHEEGKFA